MELKEEALLALIKTGKTIVLKVFTNNCPFCVEYAPIFEAEALKHENVAFVSLNLSELPKGGSQFKKLYLKLSDSSEKADVPATIVFENGEMVGRRWGRLHADKLEEFLAEVVIDDPKPDWNAELMNLFAQKGRIITICEDFQRQLDATAAPLNQINARIQELNNLLNGAK
jgi:thiol-disulfide isomerase/thioredoxin